MGLRPQHSLSFLAHLSTCLLAIFMFFSGKPRHEAPLVRPGFLCGSSEVCATGKAPENGCQLLLFCRFQTGASVASVTQTQLRSLILAQG